MKLITDELRDLSKSCKYYYVQPIVLGQPLSDYFVDLANRIDKKHDEEIKSLQSTNRKLNDAIAEKRKLNANSKSAQIEFCNVAKLREEVRSLLSWAKLTLQLPKEQLKEGTRECCEFVKFCCEAALKEPPRNCDIGTPAEQDQRFSDFCGDHDDGREYNNPCRDCECKEKGVRCEFIWSSMPYESEEPRHD